MCQARECLEVTSFDSNDLRSTETEQQRDLVLGEAQSLALSLKGRADMLQSCGSSKSTLQHGLIYPFARENPRP